jgi:SPP1 family predicted phage head-tail adaptor
MGINSLRHRVVIQSELASADGAGGYSLSWNFIATVWASVTPLSGREILAGQRLESRITHRIRMRYRSDITVTSSTRLSWNGRTFNIRAVINPGQRNRWLELLVEEGTTT